MYSKLRLLLHVVVGFSMAVAWAQQSTLLRDRVADATAESILKSVEELRPALGFEDVFVKRDSEAILNVSDLGPSETLHFEITRPGIIQNGELDESGRVKIQVGSSDGSTQIHWYKKDPATGGRVGRLLKVHNIYVTARDLQSTMQELKALIGDVEGIQIRVVGNQIYVDGRVLIPNDMNRVAAVLGKYPDVINLVEMSPKTMELLAKKMEEEIAGGPDRPRDVTVKSINNRFYLEGWVDRNSEAEAAMEICKTYVPSKYTLAGPVQETALPQCVNVLKIRQGPGKPPDQVISVRIDFVTLKRNYEKEFNFSWNPGISFGQDGGRVTYSSDTGKFLTTFTGTISNLFPKLNTASRHGYGRILKSAELLVRDGSGSGGAPDTATIMENLKFPYFVPGDSNNAGSYGFSDVSTSVSVRAASVPGSDKVNLSVNAKATEVVGEKFKDKGGPPDTLENSVQTTIIVSSGESAALGGLISDRRTVNFKRDPAGAQNDIEIFGLDKHNSFNDDKTQFVIFVTPKRLRSTSEGTDGLKRKFRLRK